MAWMKRPMNQVREYWYMGSMLASDEIAKKRIDAFHAVVVYLAVGGEVQGLSPRI